MNNLVVNGLIERTTDCAGNNLELLKRDVLFGTALEYPVIDKLSKYFGEEVKKVQYEYSPFDAFSDTTKYEIKSRRNRYLQYPTTIIAVDKTLRIKGDRIVFVFHYTDGLYYIIYDPSQFAKYEIREVEAIRKGGVRTLKPHYHIPVKDLIRINI